MGWILLSTDRQHMGCIIDAECICHHIDGSTNTIPGVKTAGEIQLLYGVNFVLWVYIETNLSPNVSNSWDIRFKIDLLLSLCCVKCQWLRWSKISVYFRDAFTCCKFKSSVSSEIPNFLPPRSLFKRFFVLLRQLAVFYKVHRLSHSRLCSKVT